jgi:hypothetical protein
MLLAGCADADTQGDGFDWASSMRRSLGNLIGQENTTGVRPRAEPPPDEGRPYPNLAAVPDRPPPVVPRLREAEIGELKRARDDAQARDEALRRGDATVPASTVAAGSVGTVVPDARGRFTSLDDAKLRQAAAQLRGRASRIQLSGEAAASLLVADRLGQLGVARERIDLLPAPTRPAGLQAVEIVVAGDPSRR